MSASRPARSGRGQSPNRDSRPTVLVGCGGLTLALTSTDEAWLQSARERFASFPGTAAPALTIAHGGEALLPAGERRIFTRATAGFDAWLDTDNRHAALPAEASLADIENLLRTLLPRLLGDGLAFHAAALAADECGVLCAGECGAGKTTLAALLPERALCDEIAVARRDGAGFVLHSTPYWTGRTGEAPLAAVMLLRHGPAHEARRLAPVTAIGRLARHALWPTDDADGMHRAFEILASLVAAVPVFELAFRPAADVWDAILDATRT